MSGGRLAETSAELGNRASLGTIKQAAEFGEAVLFSIYWPRADAVIDAVGDTLDGKVVIETMNPLGVTADFVHFHDHAFMRDSSTAEYLQKRLPGARVVRRSTSWPRRSKLLPGLRPLPSRASSTRRMITKRARSCGG